MDRLSLDDYLNLDLADAGKLPNLGYGAVEGVRCHSIRGGATTLLSSDITEAQSSFDVDDASRFPSPPFIIQVASERMQVAAVSGNTLSSVTRGHDGTEARAHGRGRTVFEVRTEYVYLISPEPVKAVQQVYIDGIRQTSGYTAYTGQAGDGHADFPGKAVIAFPAESDIIKQRNITQSERGRSSEVEALVSAASHRDLMGDTGVGVPLRYSKLWKSFTGSGSITSQTYTASLKNQTAGDAVVRALVRDSGTGAIIRHERFLVPGSSTRTITLTQEGGGWETEFALIPYTGPYDGGIEVSYMKKTVTALEPPEDEEYERYEPPVELTSFRGGGIEETPSLRPTGKALAWASYPSTSQGTMDRQVHYAEVHNPSETEVAKVRLVASESTGACLAFQELSIAPGATESISLGHSGGGWDALTRLVLVSGEIRLDRLHKEVFYVPSASALEAEKPFTSASARVVIGEDITVDAHWAPDPDGNYGGAGSLMERPDQVIKHFIVKRMGFALSDIDETSFSDAGAEYASAIPGGYRFAFLVDETRPSEFIRRLAFESRSTIKYEGGRWLLHYLPDTAPSPLRTIARQELAGEFEKFTFRKMPVVDIANDLTARFSRNYLPGTNESGWLGVSRKSDSASKTKYGTYKREYEFEAVRLQGMADHVLGHILLQRKLPLLTVEFPVFYEHFDLRAGDTVQIENPLYDGRKFYIERIKRLDKFRAEVKAIEWW
jgi:hypothetical protein